jgi:hypothetical protein
MINSPLDQTWIDFASSNSLLSGGQLVPFIPSAYQVELIKKIDPQALDPSSQADGQSILERDPEDRQTGWTTIFASYASWRAGRDESFLGVIVVESLTELTGISCLINKMLQGRSFADSKTAIKVSQGGKILIIPGGEQRVRRFLYGQPPLSFVFWDCSTPIPRDVLFANLALTKDPRLVIAS